MSCKLEILKRDQTTFAEQRPHDSKIEMFILQNSVTVAQAEQSHKVSQMSSAYLIIFFDYEFSFSFVIEDCVISSFERQSFFKRKIITNHQSTLNHCCTSSAAHQPMLQFLLFNSPHFFAFYQTQPLQLDCAHVTNYDIWAETSCFNTFL